MVIKTLKGTLAEKLPHGAVVDFHGMGVFVFMNSRAVAKLPAPGGEVLLRTHLYLREDRADLYGFLDTQSLALFELLNSVAGVGPRTALAVLDAETPENLAAAIVERRADLLTQTPGIGKKIAERIILELAAKVAAPASRDRAAAMDRDREAEEVLVNLGYGRDRIRQVLAALSSAKDATTETRIREALRALGRRTS